MKTIIRNLKLWIIAVAAVASAACSDLLDQRPQGQWTIDDIEGGAYFSQVMALYTKARHYNITSGIPAFAVHYYRSEDSRKGSTTTDGAEHVPMYENFQYSAANSLLNPYWTQNYEIINAANTVLDQMQKAQEAGEQLDEAELQCGMEARFFRGWCYFNLVRAFGEVPLVDFAITNSDEANIPKSSVDKIYELIDADLTAAEGLPRRWESKYIGRVTYGAARALHAKTYGQRGLWSQMYQAAKNVIDTRVYNLDTPFDEIFREEGENSSESVWELQCTATVAQPATNDLGSQFCQVQGCRGSGTSNLGWGWHMADQSIVDVFKEGDPRRDETLLYFSTPSKPWPAIAPEAGNAPFNEKLVSQDGLDGDYYNKKAYCSPELREYYGSNDGFWYNIRMIRYSDVVLMAAEAACEMGGEAMIEEALDYLEQVRARARGTNTNVLPKVTTTNQLELCKAIHHERHVELALEFDRFYDLVRWQEFSIAGAEDGASAVLGNKGYTAKNKYLPLPQEQVDASNGVLVQNPDYAN